MGICSLQFIKKQVFVQNIEKQWIHWDEEPNQEKYMVANIFLNRTLKEAVRLDRNFKNLVLKKI